MLKIKKNIINDGEQELILTEMVNNIKDIHCHFPEFVGEIILVGKLTKLQNRFVFNGTVQCHADFICDISTEEYRELIKTELQVVFVIDNNLMNFKDLKSENSSDEIIISENDDFLDFTNEVRDALSLALPIRRISPKYADKNFSDFFPQYSKENIHKEIDERWAKLKDISFN